MCRLSWNLGASNFWNPLGLSRPVMGLLYLLLLYDGHNGYANAPQCYAYIQFACHVSIRYCTAVTYRITRTPKKHKVIGRRDMHVHTPRTECYWEPRESHLSACQGWTSNGNVRKSLTWQVYWRRWLLGLVSHLTTGGGKQTAGQYLYKRTVPTMWHTYVYTSGEYLSNTKVAV